jgi:hypothetical protein
MLGIDFDAFVVRARLPPHEPLTALRASLSLFFGQSFAAFEPIAIAVHDRLLDSGPRAAFKWHMTETSTRVTPVTSRTWSTFNRRLPLRASAMYEITYFGGEGAMAPADRVVQFVWFPAERYSAKDATTLRYVVPGPTLEEKPAQLLELTIDLCTKLPVMSGSAGYEIQFAPGEEEAGLRGVYPALVRHPAVDVEYVVYGANPIGNARGIKGLGWLTVLGNELIAKLGGRDSLRARMPREVVVHETPNAFILQIGEHPPIGDMDRGETLPLWREVYKVVKPVHEPVIRFWMDRGQKFDLGVIDENERTEAWLRRFE